jgi:nitric oxide reductase NorE protein
MFYFVMTAIHLLHVFIGMGVLAALCRYSRDTPCKADMMRHLESGASFWHVIDVVWIVLFSLLYLVR